MVCAYRRPLIGCTPGETICCAVSRAEPTSIREAQTAAKRVCLCIELKFHYDRIDVDPLQTLAPDERRPAAPGRTCLLDRRRSLRRSAAGRDAHRPAEEVPPEVRVEPRRRAP